MQVCIIIIITKEEKWTNEQLIKMEMQNQRLDE